MGVIWIIGRKVVMQNGHEYMAQPFSVFASEPEADAAIGLITRITGEHVMKATANLVSVKNLTCIADMLEDPTP